jgi:restriction system protein
MRQSKKEHDPDRLWLNKGATFTIASNPLGLPRFNRRTCGWFLNIRGDGRYEVVYDDKENNECLAAIATPSVLLQTDVVTLGDKTEDGELVKSVRQSWIEIVKQVKRRREFLFEFPRVPRAFEMFLAATYRMDGCDEVILTPRSADRGRDVIASKTGRRILEQAKAYRATRLVSHNEVREMIGVIALDDKPSTGAITTTSGFAPTICTGNAYCKFIPDKLKLRNGTQLRDWLISLAGKTVQTRADVAV